MNYPLLPRYLFKKYHHITPDFLKNLGVRFLMLDLDNTIAKYSEHEPTATLIDWVDSIRSSDIDMYMISNSKREHRVKFFSQALDIPYISNAKKPSPENLLLAMEIAGYRPVETAFLGDQVFTDTLAANRANVISITVRPLSLKNPLLLLRFAGEIPIRTICKLKKTMQKY